MSNEPTVLYSEPIATSTSCSCFVDQPLKRQCGLHEDDCISKPQRVVKPSPYAGKRAWRKYRAALDGEKE